MKSVGSKSRSVHSSESSIGRNISKTVRSKSLPPIIYPSRKRKIGKNKTDSESGFDLEINKPQGTYSRRTEKQPSNFIKTRGILDKNNFQPPTESDPDSNDTDKLLYTPLLGGLTKQNFKVGLE